jgi:hypothetical protein
MYMGMLVADLSEWSSSAEDEGAPRRTSNTIMNKKVFQANMSSPSAIKLWSPQLRGARSEHVDRNLDAPFTTLLIPR